MLEFFGVLGGLPDFASSSAIRARSWSTCAASCSASAETCSSRTTSAAFSATSTAFRSINDAISASLSTVAARRVIRKLTHIPSRSATKKMIPRMRHAPRRSGDATVRDYGIPAKMPTEGRAITENGLSLWIVEMPTFSYRDLWTCAVTRELG